MGYADITQQEIDYLINLVESDSPKDWNKAVVELNANLHPDSLRKSFNVGRYCGYNIAKYYQEKIENDLMTDEEFLRLETLRDEEYKERVRLQDANREKRNLLREEARFEKLLETYKETISDGYEIKLNPYKKKTSNDKKYAVLCLSDWHIGKIIDNQFNYFDNEVAVERVNELRDKVIDRCSLHKVTNLIVEINGDMMEGLIHVSSRVYSEMDAVEQIVYVTDLLVSFINDLKPYFEEIKVYTTIGNHSRLLSNKSETITKESFESLIPIRLRDKLKDVTVVSSNGFDFLQYKINDKVICVAHGQNDKLVNVVSDFSKIYKTVPNEIHLGHTHSYKDVNDCDVIVNVNGCLCGADDYAITLRKITEPSQNLIIYDDDRCVYELKIK